jgi:simple sugar transport system permease protein
LRIAEFGLGFCSAIRNPKLEEEFTVAGATVETGTKAAPAPTTHRAWWRVVLDTITVPVLAVFTALVISGIMIAISDDAVVAAFPTIAQDPLKFLGAVWNAVSTAYTALFNGAFGKPDVIATAFGKLFATGDWTPLQKALWPLSESLVASTPYIFAGLGVALGFKCGLFNIGVEGQLFIGALVSVYVGYAVTGLPWYIHLPLALIAGALGGALWAGIPGFLKARTGAHEVITTIMMNYIAFRLSDFLLNGPMKRLDPTTGEPGWNPITPPILGTAWLPKFFPDPLRFHAGFFLALAAAVFVYWFLWKTTLGFEIRTVGANPKAAKYAGMNVPRNFVIAMAISGALAALTGANEVLGVNHSLAAAFSSGYGFDAIALALLGKSHPLGVVLASLLFGILRNGATRMQSVAGVPIDIISIVQALVIAFIAAPAIIRWLYRVRAERAEAEVFTRGWGG